MLRIKLACSFILESLSRKHRYHPKTFYHPCLQSCKLKRFKHMLERRSDYQFLQKSVLPLPQGSI